MKNYIKDAFQDINTLRPVRKCLSKRERQTLKTSTSYFFSHNYVLVKAGTADLTDIHNFYITNGTAAI